MALRTIGPPRYARFARYPPKELVRDLGRASVHRVVRPGVRLGLERLVAFLALGPALLASPPRIRRVTRKRDTRERLRFGPADRRPRPRSSAHDESSAGPERPEPRPHRGDRGGDRRRGRRPDGVGRDPPRRRPGVLLGLRPDRGRRRGRARRARVARVARGRHCADARDPRLPEARDRLGAVLLPGRRHGPDARLRPGRRRGRREVRLRRHPLRLGRGLDAPAVGGGRAHRQGAAVHRRGPDPRGRGAPDRARQPRRAARPSWTNEPSRSPRRSRRTSRSSCR